MNELQQFIQSKPMGFLTDKDIPQLIALDPLFPVLVRCGGCRFTCGAQDVVHLEACIKAGGDHVRDVSFPVGSTERAARWRPDCVVSPVTHIAESFFAIPKPAVSGNLCTFTEDPSGENPGL